MQKIMIPSGYNTHQYNASQEVTLGPPGENIIFLLGKTPDSEWNRKVEVPRLEFVFPSVLVKLFIISGYYLAISAF